MATSTQTDAKSSSTKEPSVDDLSRQIEMLKKDITTLTSTITEIGKSEADRAVKRAKSKGEDLRQAGEDQLHMMRLRAETYGEEAGEFVRNQPATALGLAAALGLVTGLLLSGRR